MELYLSTKTVSGSENINIKMNFPTLLDKAGKPGDKHTSIIPGGENGIPRYYSEVKVMAIPVSEESATIKNQ